MGTASTTRLAGATVAFNAPLRRHARRRRAPIEAPAEVTDLFGTCPSPDPVHRLGGVLPAHQRLQQEIKLGDTVASIPGPIEMVIGAASVVDRATCSITGSGGSGGGEVSSVKIPGGLLGMPSTDPLIDALGGLLSVSATPAISASRELGEGQSFQFLNWLNGHDDAHRRVQLHPALTRSTSTTSCLGGRCHIPPFTLSLPTNGTTVPPEGSSRP